MLMDFFREKKKQLIILLAVVLFVAGGYAVRMVTWQISCKQQEKEITDVLDTLTYAMDDNQQEVSRIKQLLDHSALSDNTRGLIYKALVELTCLSENENDYNDYAGWGLFYLLESGNYNDGAKLASEYAVRLYTNGGYAAALLLLDNIALRTDISALTDLEAQASYNLVYAYLQQLKGQYAMSSKYIYRARECIRNIDGDSRDFLLARYSLMNARLYVYRKEFNTAAQYLAGYSETDSFGLPESNIFLITDYLLPYYELNIKVALADGNWTQAAGCLDQYLAYCREYNFRMLEINMLQYFISNSEGLAENGVQQEKLEQYRSSYDEESSLALAEISQNYTYTLLYNVENASKEMRATKAKQNTETLSLRIFIIIFVAGILAYCIVSIMLYYSTLDGLTRLKNRKTYDREHTALEKQKTVYYLLILDIDNFKRINDTYGHEFGDEVLRKISEILKRRVKKAGRAYRYGGEELCAIMKTSDADACLELAESIRREIEETKWIHGVTITVSGGISASIDGHNPFTTADEYLYYSKQNGKNRITSRFTNLSSR